MIWFRFQSFRIDYYTDAISPLGGAGICVKHFLQSIARAVFLRIDAIVFDSFQTDRAAFDSLNAVFVVSTKISNTQS